MDISGIQREEQWQEVKKMNSIDIDNIYNNALPPQIGM